MKIKDLPQIDQPREKLEKYGVKKLFDFELLAMLLGSGIKGLNVVQLSKKIITVMYKVGIKNITIDDLLKIKGLGKVKAAQIISSIEFVNRMNSKNYVQVLSPEDIWKACSDINNSKKEHFIVFYLDTQDYVIERKIIFVGTLDTSLVHPREIFEPAISLSASSIVVAHNHPSGLLEPSEGDINTTKRLKEAGGLLGIPLQNHIILTNKGYFSFKQQSLI